MSLISHQQDTKQSNEQSIVKNQPVTIHRLQKTESQISMWPTIQVTPQRRMLSSFPNSLQEIAIHTNTQDLQIETYLRASTEQSQCLISQYFNDIVYEQIQSEKVGFRNKISNPKQKNDNVDILQQKKVVGCRSRNIVQTLLCPIKFGLRQYISSNTSNCQNHPQFEKNKNKLYELIGSKYLEKKNGKRHWSKQQFGFIFNLAFIESQFWEDLISVQKLTRYLQYNCSISQQNRQIYIKNCGTLIFAYRSQDKIPLGFTFTQIQKQLQNRN